MNTNAKAATQRCRVGDLAIRLDDSYSGQIVEVHEYEGSVYFPKTGETILDAWKVLHPSYEDGYSYYCEDKYLLPIRPDELTYIEREEMSDLIN